MNLSLPSSFLFLSLSVVHTTFKYCEHFSLPAVTTPNYICYISLNRLAVLFAALAYTRCPHLTSCSEVTTIILGEVSTWRPIISIQFIPRLGTDFPLNLKDIICFWKIRFWRSYSSYLLAFSTISSRGKMSYKMPTAIVGIFIFYFFAIYSSKMIQTLKKKGRPVLGLELKELFAHSS